jgi:hypothetical protein
LARGLALCLVLAGCTATRQQVQSTFWLEAPADPLLLIEPPALLAADVTELVLQGVVTRHQPAFETVADHSLELLRDDGETIELHYSAGMQQRAPVERGQLVRVRLWQSVQPPLPPLRAWMIEVWQPDADGAAQLPAMVVQINQLIPPERLPAPLRRLLPTDSLVYQAAERLRDSCQRAVAHRAFVIELDDTELALQRNDVDLLPGMRIEMGVGSERMDVLLLDNRELLQTDCADQLPSLWAFSAVAAPEPLREQAAVPQPPTLAVPLADGLTPTSAPVKGKGKPKSPRKAPSPR